MNPIRSDWFVLGVMEKASTRINLVLWKNKKSIYQDKNAPIDSKFVLNTTIDIPQNCSNVFYIIIYFF